MDIFGRTYKVLEKDEVIVEGKSVSGSCDVECGIIEINKHHTYPFKLRILAHECGHALWARIGLGETDIPENLEEIIVDTFGTYFVESFCEAIKK